MSAADVKATAEESISRLFEPDTILPSQFSDRVNLGPSSYPEKRLMLAVLEDAVATFQRYVDARDRRGQRLHREAEEWFQSDDQEWPFAFANICNALEIEAEYLRRGLTAWKQKQLEKTAGARVYRFPFRRVNGRRHSISLRSDGMRQSA
ncbi:MAG: hypothetical protein ACREQY_24420 [Candidatus Binatia bacterium]